MTPEEERELNREATGIIINYFVLSFIIFLILSTLNSIFAQYYISYFAELVKSNPNDYGLFLAVAKFEFTQPLIPLVMSALIFLYLVLRDLNRILPHETDNL